MSFLTDPETLSLLLHMAVVTSVAGRVIMLRPATGVALAWLLLVTALPIAGLVLYILFGERRVGQKRARQLAALRTDFQELAREYLKEHMTCVDWARHPSSIRGMNQLGLNMARIPTLVGNTLDLHSDTQQTLQAIAADIDNARRNVHMEFYIWSAGGNADAVVESLIRAAQRGVCCRVLVDHLGSRPWLRSKQPERLRDAGVEVRSALPIGFFSGLFQRNDLRLHRKIISIDGRLAWTGSMNLVDPRYFKQQAGVGEWIDAMVRIEGNAVLPLGATIVGDWQLETGEQTVELVRSADLHRVQQAGHADVQVVPSGPGASSDTILQMLLSLVNSAHEELMLTTPYFVPDESMLRALRGAAARGVRVELIVPARVDSKLVRYASRSYFGELMQAGVRIRPFRGGLLHTKSIAVDGEVAMIGTVNLDMRSLWLNYEVSLFVYDAGFTRQLQSLQRAYLRDCDSLDAEAWEHRQFTPRFMENLVRLVSPLL